MQVTSGGLYASYTVCHKNMSHELIKCVFYKYNCAYSMSISIPSHFDLFVKGWYVMFPQHGKKGTRLSSFYIFQKNLCLGTKYSVSIWAVSLTSLSAYTVDFLFITDLLIRIIAWTDQTSTIFFLNEAKAILKSREAFL